MSMILNIKINDFIDTMFYYFEHKKLDGFQTFTWLYFLRLNIKDNKNIYVVYIM